MKKMSKLLSVIIALVLCVSMVTPAMAIDLTEDYLSNLEQKTHTDGYKYVDLKVEKDENGNVTDNTFNMTGDLNIDYTLRFSGKDDVVLNMNGHTLNHEGASGSVIRTEKTNLTINGEGEDGSMGTITGGNAVSDGNTYSENGGGVAANGGDLTVNNVHITGNVAEKGGSAIWAKGSDNVTLDNVLVDNAETGTNEKGEPNATGGTVYCKDVNKVTVKDSTITDNTAASAGAGLAFNDCNDVTVENTVISNNTSTGVGSDDDQPLDEPVPFGAGVIAQNVKNLNMTGVTISGNTADTANGTGGGMYAYNVDKISMDEVTISGNKAYYGGGVYTNNVGSIEMNNTQITGNTAGGAYGGGMYIYSDSTSTTVNGTNTVIADNTFYGGSSANDVFAYANGVTIDMKFGPTTYGDKEFDGWSKSFETSEFVREGEEADEDGVFGNNYSNNWGWMTFHWTEQPEQPDEGDKTPVPPVLPEPPVVPVNPTPDPDPEEPVEIEEPETPLGELPDDPVEIEEPEVPLGELPEIEIDEPDVPLGDVPQTGEASTMMFVVVLLACSMGLVYVNTGKRKENA
ncbi:MAG: hypothetical protein HDT33_06080 [Clostridiales bacterium]|nr:hypothetical protein [Clostridiales bacterium]